LIKSWSLAEGRELPFEMLEPKDTIGRKADIGFGVVWAIAKIKYNLSKLQQLGKG
jgi:hypothetical protein